MKDGADRESERLKEMATHKFEKIIQDNLKNEIEECIRTVARRVLDEVQNTTFKNSSNGNNIPSSCEDKRSKSEGTRGKLDRQTGVVEKVFMERDSLLTELFEIPHIRTIYHISLVILILLFLNTMVYDLVDSGRLNLGLHLIAVSFSGLDVVVTTWVVMLTCAVLPYYLFRGWAFVRPSLATSPKLLCAWDFTWLCLLIIYQVLFLIFPIKVQTAYGLPVASSFIVLLEMMRFIMKIHAFVRSVSPRVLERAPKQAPLPVFSWYLYFLFAPTLVYRDTYPRTKHTRWDVVAMRLIEVAAIIVYISYLCERFFINVWADFGKPDNVLEAEQLVLSLFSAMLPALLTFVCGFYLLLHCWQNAAAEILTFADRRFYMDWWNQSGYGGFYRTWNMVVHDWLYTYIFRDVLMLSGNRTVATILVFLVSAIFHEIVLTYAFGIFYPVLLVAFAFFGCLFVFLTRQKTKAIGNIFMWLTLAIGNGIIWSLYCMEMFARINCPVNESYDSILPLSWSCQPILLKSNWQFQITS